MGKRKHSPKRAIEVRGGKKGRECTKCGIWKPLETNFNKDKKGLEGRTAQCKSCLSTYKRKYYKSNSEKEKQRTTEWYENNKEYALSRQKEYREKNKDKVAERNRNYRVRNIGKLKEYAYKYRVKNRDKVSLQKREWYLANKDIVKVNNTRRRSRESIVRNDLTVNEKEEIWEHFANRCAITGDDDTSVDHVIPINTGRGGTYKGNIIPLKTQLNYSKGAENIFEWFNNAKERFNLSEERFNKLIEYLAKENGKTVDEYREYVYWCHNNPITVTERQAVTWRKNSVD